MSRLTIERIKFVNVLYKTHNVIKVFYESLGCIFVNHCTRVTHAKYRVKMKRKEKKNKNNAKGTRDGMGKGNDLFDENNRFN